MIHHKDIASLRKDYRLSELLEVDADEDPIRQFHRWFNQAVHSEIVEPNAMCLSTVDNGIPDSRIVLLKGIEHHGFVFFSNYNSHKGKQIAINANVNLNFNWLELERQIRISGIAERLSDKENDEYFYSRPFESRVGATISIQSELLDSRESLEKAMSEALQKYKDKEPQRPVQWGGYIVRPVKIEFWQGRPGRLHDRLLYTKDQENWKMTRLFP